MRGEVAVASQAGVWSAGRGTTHPPAKDSRDPSREEVSVSLGGLRSHSRTALSFPPNGHLGFHTSRAPFDGTRCVGVPARESLG
jgi:hypothetical protein